MPTSAEEYIYAVCKSRRLARLGQKKLKAVWPKIKFTVVHATATSWHVLGNYPMKKELGDPMETAGGIVKREIRATPVEEEE